MGVRIAEGAAQDHRPNAFLCDCRYDRLAPLAAEAAGAGEGRPGGYRLRSTSLDARILITVSVNDIGKTWKRERVFGNEGGKKVLSFPRFSDPFFG